MLPIISGFVGGDTVSCIVATGLVEEERPTVLIDIGTNGEIVVANGNGEQGMARGDIITEVNGHSVASPDEFLSQLDGADSGDLLRLYVFRPRAERSFFVFIRIE